MKARKIVWMAYCLLAVVRPAVAATCVITPTPDGGMQFENDVMTLRTAPEAGQDKGIVAWTFLGTGLDLLDSNRAYHNLFGEIWDTITIGTVSGRNPLPKAPFYAPVARGEAKDGSAAGVIQEYRGDHLLRRTMILRRDYAVIEIRWEFANVSGIPSGGAFRFFSAPFPGALTGTALKNTTVFMPTTNGVLALDQNLHSAEYEKLYGADTFVLPRWKDEPLRWWTRRKFVTPPLADLWTAEVNRNNGNGLVLIGDPDTLIGYYNCPKVTIETVTEAIALQQGETWNTVMLAGAFAGAAGRTVSEANALFITCGNQGIIPLFRGTLETGGQTYPADPATLIACDPTKLSDSVARDTQGKELGTIKGGVCSLSPDEVVFETPVKPSFSGDIYRPDSAAVKAFLQEGCFTVYCGWHNTDTVKEAARTIAQRLGAGLAWTNPGGRLLVVGAADRDIVTRNIGLVENTVSDTWPGTGRGAVQYLPHLAFTGQPALLVTGSDTAGAEVALETFQQKELVQAPIAPQGYGMHAVGIEEKMYPWSRPGQQPLDGITIEGARGEYESAQLLLSAYERQQGVAVVVSDLKHTETGIVLSNQKDSTNHRRRNGPVQVRFVNYYPLHAEDGFTGFPDPLLARPETSIPAGESRAVWLTFIIPEHAPAGLYTGTVTCTASGGKKIVPIALTVWDFSLPRDDVMVGEAYTEMDALKPHQKRWTSGNMIDSFIVNMVEHGMRLIHLHGDHMFQWRFDDEGRFKGLDAPGLIASADGKVLLDATGFEELKRRCDHAGKPHKLRYTFYDAHATFYGEGIFRRRFPERHDDKPPRDGNKTLNGYYIEEMFGMIRQLLERNDWLDDVYLKVSDEPGDVKKWYDELCQAAVASGLQFYTAHGSGDVAHATPEMSAIWQPVYASYNEAFMDRIRQAGKLVSWYNCGQPPKTVVYVTANEWRSYLWQAAKADLDIVAWWGIQCWGYYDGGLDVWRSQSHANSLIYPEHPEKPRFQLEGKGWQDEIMLDSIRWETIRDGMEDAWMITLLRRLTEEARQVKLTDEAEAATTLLDGIWAELFPTRLHYRPPFDKLLDARRQIAVMIIRLQTALAIVPSVDGT